MLFRRRKIEQKKNKNYNNNNNCIQLCKVSIETTVKTNKIETEGNETKLAHSRPRIQKCIIYVSHSQQPVCHSA